MPRYEKLEPDDRPPCDDAGLYCTGTARYYVAGRNVCPGCKRVREDSDPHDDTAKDGT